MRLLAIRRSAPLSLLLAASLAAQTETSPKGFLATEGNAGTSPFGYYSTAYGYGTSYVQVDNTNVGQARLLKALSLRRNGTSATNIKYVARTVKLGIRMSQASWSLLKANSKQDDSAILAAPWTTVHAEKLVNFPDLTQQPAAGPAPFSVLLQLDTYFPYDGTSALAFQVLCSPSTNLAVSSADYPLDLDITNPAIAPQAFFGTGCAATGFSQPVRHNSYLVNRGPNGNTSWTLGFDEAPSNVPGVILLGLANPNLNLGACETLFATPDVALAGTTDGDGGLGWELLFPHQAWFIGATIYSQGAVYDAGKAPVPVAMSGGVRIVYPADPVQPAVARAAQLVPWGNPAWPTQHVFYRGESLIFGLHE